MQANPSTQLRGFCANPRFHHVRRRGVLETALCCTPYHAGTSSEARRPEKLALTPSSIRDAVTVRTTLGPTVRSSHARTSRSICWNLLLFVPAHSWTRFPGFAPGVMSGRSRVPALSPSLPPSALVRASRSLPRDAPRIGARRSFDSAPEDSGNGRSDGAPGEQEQLGGKFAGLDGQAAAPTETLYSNVHTSVCGEHVRQRSRPEAGQAAALTFCACTLPPHLTVGVCHAFISGTGTLFSAHILLRCQQIPQCCNGRRRSARSIQRSRP